MYGTGNWGRYYRRWPIQLVRQSVPSVHATKSHPFGAELWKAMCGDQHLFPGPFEGCSREMPVDREIQALGASCVENTGTRPSAGIWWGGAEPLPRSSGVGLPSRWEESDSSGHTLGFVYSGHTNSCWTKQEGRKSQGVEQSQWDLPERGFLRMRLAGWRRGFFDTWLL